MDQPAYQMAVTVCNSTSDKLQRHVCQYFTDIIVTRPSEDDDEADYTETEAAHGLVKQLNRSCPGLLHNVVPQLEEEMRVEEVKIRVLATQVLGEMFAEKGGAELVKKYPTTWATWLGRQKDRSAAVRMTFVEGTQGLIVNLPEVRQPIEGESRPYFLSGLDSCRRGPRFEAIRSR
jgi:sister chromatid cohesion protein PDS5